jgi:hypothetical protein|tara:strand:+ start:30 stop:503 length:474 start_codon:yes stop_codon:yes gene_type:complete
MAIPPLLIPLLATGAATAIAGDTMRKAGDNKKIKEILEKNKMYEQMLGDPTGGFGYQTGFGPGMELPLSGYQSILRYNQQMSDQQRRALAENLAVIEPFTDRSKRRDFERNMAAARFRTQLGTQQGLTLQGQRGAQALAQDAQRAAGTALASNYQYQ